AMERLRALCCERSANIHRPSPSGRGRGEGMKKKTEPDRQYRERVYKIVRRIARGSIMTYGQIAYTLGEGYTPRTVGFVMHGADGSQTPWQRVINSQGRCSTGRIVLPADKQ